MATKAIAGKIHHILSHLISLERQRWLIDGSVACLLVAVSIALTLLFKPLLQSTPAALLYMGVMLSSWFGGLRSGTLAIVLSTLALHYFLHEGSPWLSRTDFKIGFPVAVFVLVSLLITYLNEARLQTQKHAETSFQSWRMSEARFTRFTEANIIGIFRADLQGAIIDANDAFLQMIGYTREDLLMGRIRWDDMTPPEFAEVSANSRQELQVLGACTPFEKEYIRKDGSRVPVLLGSVLQDDHTITGFVLDLSEVKRYEIEQQRVEAALRDSETRYRYLANSIPQLVWMADSDGTMLDVNQRWTDYTGLTLEQVQREGWQHIVHPDDVSIMSEAWAIAVQLGTSYQAEGRQRRADGAYRWHLHQATPQKNALGEIVKWYGTATDIHDRKQAETEREHLLLRERYHTQQLQGLTTAALAINSALSVEEVLQVITNQAAAIIGTHQSMASITIDQNWAQAIHEVYLSDKYAKWRDVGRSTKGEGRYTCICQLSQAIRMTQAEVEAHPDWQQRDQKTGQSLPLRGWLAVPLTRRNGQNLGLIQLSDKQEGEFTETDEAILMQLAQMASIAVENARLYEAEQQARTVAEISREEAQAANRIKDEFLAVLSHELRSPLNPILGWTKLLQTRTFNAEKTAQALATIERNAKLQAQLIEDLLDVSRILRGKMVLNVSTVDLASTIEAAIETVSLAAEAKAIAVPFISSEGAPHKVQVNGDAARLQQIVWNLLTNAIKFTPTGGEVEVRLEEVIAPFPHASAYAQITVSDTGKGIHPEFLPYVFDYFRQEDGATTRKFGGLGLGLAIVRHLTEQHGGTVHVDSAGEGQGATFTIRLPLPEKQPQVSLRRGDEGTQLLPLSLPPLTGLSILVVDDEPDMRDLMATILNDHEAEIKVAASATEALMILEHWHPDILISDIGMPDMDGYMLMHEIQARSRLSKTQNSASAHGDMIAIALTAYAAEIDQQQALAAGFHSHLAKPVEPNTLIQLLVQLRAAKTPSRLTSV